MTLREAWALVKDRFRFFLWCQCECFRMTFSTKKRRQREADELLRDVRSVQQQHDRRARANKLLSLYMAGGFSARAHKDPPV